QCGVCRHSRRDRPLGASLEALLAQELATPRQASGIALILLRRRPLRRFPAGSRALQCLDRDLPLVRKTRTHNVGVNFDPANMILYGQDNPIEALRTLGPWLKQCHLKDANRTRTPGTWGEEVVVGAGEVDWLAFFRTLEELKFTGDLCIERE